MNKEQINKKDIRKDIRKYIKLKNAHMTSEREYTKLMRLKEKAEALCLKFDKDSLDISSVPPEDFADYLNLFCYGDLKQTCLEKLEKQTGLNTKLYLRTSRRKLYKSDIFKYMPAWKLKLKYMAFRRLCKKINSGKSVSYNQTSKADKLYSEAEEYLNVYLKDEIEVKNKDAKALRNYFCIMFAQRTPEVQSAVNKLTDQIKRYEAEKPVSFAQKLRKRVSAKVKIAAVAAVAVVGGLLGAKSCSGTTTRNSTFISPKNEVVAKQPQLTDTISAQTEVKQKIRPVIRAEKTVPMKKTTDKIQATTVKSDAQPKKVQDSSVQAVWKNYYDTALEILCKGNKKQTLYQKIDGQLQKGMFTLPQSISREKLAYTYVIYQKYGIKSAVSDALAATKKLSAEAQKQLVNDILAAGDKGQGVKAMAQKRYGKLTGYSSYNHAGKQLQKKHAHNLQELFKLKKLSQNYKG